MVSTVEGNKRLAHNQERGGFWLPMDWPKLRIDDLRRVAREPKMLLAMLNGYRNGLAIERESQRVGENMKTRFSRVAHKYEIGDPSQLVMDTADRDSVIAYGRFLFEQGVSEIWMGTADDDDMTDVRGDHNAETPLIRGIKSLKQLEQAVDLIWGRIGLEDVDQALLAANADKNNHQRLEKVEGYIPNYFAKKLAKRYAMASEAIDNQGWEQMATVGKKEKIEEHWAEAKSKIDQIMKGEMSWKDLNKSLKSKGVPTINPINHPLHKVFRQDKPEWKIADMMATEKSIIIEIPMEQYTHRAGDGNGTIRIEFTYEDGKPLIICDKRDIGWLVAINNSREFFEILEKQCYPALGKSSYAQIEIMFDKLQNKIVFATDGIMGEDPERENKDKKYLHEPLLLGDFFDNWERCKVRSVEDQTRKNSLEGAYLILRKLEAGIIPADQLRALLEPLIAETQLMSSARLDELVGTVEAATRGVVNPDVLFVTSRTASDIKARKSAWAKLAGYTNMKNQDSREDSERKLTPAQVYASKSHTIPHFVRPTMQELARLMSEIRFIEGMTTTMGLAIQGYLMELGLRESDVVL